MQKTHHIMGRNYLFQFHQELVRGASLQLS